MADSDHLDYRLRCHTKRTDLPDDVVRDIADAYYEIGMLQRKIEDIKNGFEGCCHACEPVGAMNKKLRFNAEGWQPIDTAPKDGKMVDLWVTYCCFGKERSQRLVDCYWYNDSWRQGSYDIEEGMTITHWMRIRKPNEEPPKTP